MDTDADSMNEIVTLIEAVFTVKKYPEKFGTKIDTWAFR